MRNCTYKGRQLLCINGIIFLIILLLSSCANFIVDIDLQDEWIVAESGKIVLHYRPQNFSSVQSPALEQAQTILHNQNYYYQVIQDSIKRRFNDKVLVYLFNKDEAKRLIGTNTGGHAIPRFNTYYYTFLTDMPGYTDQYGIENPFLGAHELVHVITHRSIGYPGTKLMSEGYAVWLDGTYARYSISDIICTYRDNAPNKILTPDQLLSEATDDESVFYPNSGVLVRFLVQTYGIEKINSLFTLPEEKFKKEFTRQTGSSWETMCAEYEEYIKNIEKE